VVQDLRPFLVQTARDLVIEGVRAYMRGRGTDATHQARAASVTVIDVTPTDSECPYCEIALFLAGARLYVERAGSRPSLASLYRGLSLHRLFEAGKAARRLSPSMENMGIQREIRALETGLRDEALGITNPLAMQAIGLLADRVLDLAEKADKTG